jgi:glycosyltransferase involved in cell wall biosynthesis
MKIAILQPRISYFQGGGEIVVIRYIQAMVSKGHEIFLYTLKTPLGYSEHYKQIKDLSKSIRFIEIDVSDIEDIYGIYPGLDRYRWDRESIHFTKRLGLDWTDNLSKMDICMSFYILDGIFVNNKNNLLILMGAPSQIDSYASGILGSYSKIIGCSNKVIEHWRKNTTHVAFEDKPLYQIIDAVNENYKHTLNNNLLYVGRLIPRKGVSELIKATNLLANKGFDISLSIAGDGPEKSSLLKLVGDLNIGDKVKFLGHVQDTKSLYLTHDLSIFPSLGGDGLMTTIMEAQACGSIVITSPNNGSEDAITHEYNGFLVKPKPHLIADRIQLIFKMDENSIATLRTRAIKSVGSKFSEDAFLKRLEELCKI